MKTTISTNLLSAVVELDWKHAGNSARKWDAIWDKLQGMWAICLYAKLQDELEIIDFLQLIAREHFHATPLDS